MKTIVGIDPGQKGAICTLDMEGNVLSIIKMPETPLDICTHIRELHTQYTDIVAYLEKVGGMPGQGGSSMFNFGKNYGHIEMALLSTNTKFYTTTPQKWQKQYQMGGRKEAGGHVEWKRKLKEKAQQLFPNINVTLVNADALLIAEYARQQEK